MDILPTLNSRAAAAFAFLTICALSIAAQPETDREVYRLSLPDKNWAIDVLLRGFNVDLEESKPLSYRFSAGRMPTKGTRSNIISCRVDMSPAQGLGDAFSVRESLKKRRKALHLKVSEHKGIPIIEYRPPTFSPELAGSAASFPTLNVLEALWVHDQIWITVSLSIMGSIEQEDRKFFHSLIESVRIVDTSTLSNSFDHYQKGRALYVRHEYAGAIQFFAVALELEKKKRELEYSQWAQLVLELADCYGAIRKLDSFKQLLDYAVAVNAAEYRFHWALARYFAANGNLNNTIESLRLAYKHQPSELRNQKFRIGGYLVDPLIDKGFERFHKVEEFRKAVKQMKQERN